MTSINLFFQKDRAVALSDSLFISSETGMPVAFGNKCEPVPGQPTAVMARGDFRVPGAVALIVSCNYGGIDDIINASAAQVATAYDDWCEAEGIAESANNGVQIAFFGWSESKYAPRGALLVLDRGKWSFNEIGDEGFTGPLPNEQEFSRLAMLGVEPGYDWGAEDFDPVRHGIPYLEAQRRMKLPMPYSKRSENIHIVGGHVLLTEVDREGVRQKVIHCWPGDRVGKPIEPEPFADPANVIPMSRIRENRAQIEARRLKEKRARRAAQKNRRRA